MNYASKYFSVTGALALTALIAGCNGSNDNGGPSPLPSPSPSPTATATASPTAPTDSGPALNVLAIQRTSSGPVALRFNTSTATQPTSNPITGFPTGVNILGIDRRPANGNVYVLGSDRRLYLLNSTNFSVTAVGNTLAIPLSGSGFGFDFNPVPDRIRLVSNEELNARLNPDTGGVVDFNTDSPGLQTDGRLAYAAGDVNASRDPNIVAAAYTNSTGPGATSTTNYAIDTRLGILVTQGTAAGNANPVSPNTGQLFTVGSLGVPIRNRNTVSFDIGANNAAVASIDNTLYRINLSTGAATRIGPIGTSSSTDTIVGLTVLP
jgi:hypothetical protein